MLSQDALGGREVNMEALVPCEPALHLWVLVGCVVVTDEIEILILRSGPLNQAKELQPLLMTVPLHAHGHGHNFAIPGVERREQRSRAVALVIVSHRFATTALHRQAGLRAVQRLHLTLFIHAQNQRVLRRI